MINEGDTSSTGLLSSIPTALNRWAEEARVLDGDSMHDCITGNAGMVSWMKYLNWTLCLSNW